MKVLFLQYLADSYGGIEFVNSSLSKKMHEDGVDVSLFCLWSAGDDHNIGLDDSINKFVMGKKYSRPSYKNMLKNSFKLKLKEVFKDVKSLFKYFYHNIIDYKNMKKNVANTDFDYIIVANHKLIKCVPNDKLNKVIMHMHSGIDFYINDKKILKFLLKYNEKIYKFLWLTKNACDMAKSLGLTNSIFINNPVKFLTDETSLLNNNKLVYIGRLSKEKRVDKLIKIFNLASKKNKKISLDIYGTGYLEKDITNLLKKTNNDRIKYCGGTNNSKEVLLNSSMLALTSLYEGLSMVCLEAYECGVPVIAFDFGPAVTEVIENNKTGFIIEKENELEYVNKLLEYFDLKDKSEFTKNTKKFVKKFEINKIIKEWYKILK